MLLEHRHAQIANLVANIALPQVHVLNVVRDNLQQAAQAIFRGLPSLIRMGCVFIQRKLANALQRVILLIMPIVEEGCVFKVAIIATASTVLDLQQPYVISLMASV